MDPICLPHLKALHKTLKRKQERALLHTDKWVTRRKKQGKREQNILKKEIRMPERLVVGSKLKKEVEDEEKHVEDDSILKTLGEGEA